MERWETLLIDKVVAKFITMLNQAPIGSPLVKLNAIEKVGKRKGKNGGKGREEEGKRNLTDLNSAFFKPRIKVLIYERAFTTKKPNNKNITKFKKKEERR